VFLAIMLILHNLPFLSWKTKKINLLIASYVFYAAWNPPFILLLWLSTVVDYFVGRALYTQENKHKKRLLLVLSLIGNLGMLCFFKYGNFLLENFVALTQVLGFNFHPAKPDIILPAGISFYTFTTLCYTIDMYKRKSEPVRSFLDFALFVSFFPHLVAGPIVRPPQLVPQFQHPHRATRQQLMQGLFSLSLGLFMKVVLADTLLASTANSVFGFARSLPGLDAWMGVLAFSGQIFFDFAGYSTCAIGVALCLGFILPENFRYPYAAIGFTDFWRRWHITLSTWLRDYLYIPLGGNRKGEVKTYFNLMITMLLGGLWHGASWTFVVWGALHGLYLCIEKWFKQIFRSREKNSFENTVYQRAGLTPVWLQNKTFLSILLALATFFLVNITWVFFRAKSFPAAWRLLSAMFGQTSRAAPILPTVDILKVTIVVSLMFIFHWLMRNTSVIQVAKRMSWWALACVWAFFIISIIVCQKSADSFIYFQF
jgi:D-alanyl-lipoteichoic acid acyltransferase DltB (MBOAT superfamily)